MPKPLQTRQKYDLIVDGLLLHATMRDHESAEAEARAVNGSIRDYLVSVTRINPRNRRDVEWEKEEGFSVWVDPSRPPSDPLYDLEQELDRTFGR